MSKLIINNSIHNWVNNNRELLEPYQGQWVAHNANEVLASDGYVFCPFGSKP